MVSRPLTTTTKILPLVVRSRGISTKNRRSLLLSKWVLKPADARFERLLPLKLLPWCIVIVGVLVIAIAVVPVFAIVVITVFAISVVLVHAIVVGVVYAIVVVPILAIAVVPVVAIVIVSVHAIAVVPIFAIAVVPILAIAVVPVVTIMIVLVHANVVFLSLIVVVVVIPVVVVPVVLVLAIAIILLLMLPVIVGVVVVLGHHRGYGFRRGGCSHSCRRPLFVTIAIAVVGAGPSARELAGAIAVVAFRARSRAIVLALFALGDTGEDGFGTGHEGCVKAFALPEFRMGE